MKLHLNLVLLLVLTAGNLFGQDTTKIAGKGEKAAAVIEKVFKYAPIPYVGYSTETDIIFGVAKYNGFKIRSPLLPDSLIQPSSVLFFGYYTLEHQYKIETTIDLMHGANKYNSKLDIMFVDYPSYYWGIGNDTPEEDKILVDFKNVRVIASFDYNFYKKLYIGATYTYNNYLQVRPVNGDSIDNIDAYTDNEGVQSGLGVRFFRESRDNRIRATKGSYIHVTYDIYGKFIGSDFNYTALTIDLRKFITPIPKLTIAGQFFSEAKFGDVPIQSMAVLGGTERMRGIYENRYRDKTVVLAQVELRFPLVWIISGTVYGGMGQVAPTYGNLKMNSFKYGYGTGLRVLIDKATDSVLRFDWSFRKGGHGFFIGFNEAF